MANGKWIKWLPEKGAIDSSYGRLIVFAEGFVRGFVDELIKSGGPGLTQKFLKDMCASMDFTVPEKVEFHWDDFEALLDKSIGPFEKVENLPDIYGDWDGSSRRMVLQTSIPVKLWPMVMVKALMESAEMSLSERGARSIIGHASWRSGRQFGEVLGNAWGWDSRESMLKNIGDVMPMSFRSLGYGSVKIKIDEPNNIVAFIMKHAYEVEARGKDSQMTIARNQIEGIGDYVASLEKLTSKTKEYPLGDADDTRVIVAKMHVLGEDVDIDKEPWKKLVGV